MYMYTHTHMHMQMNTHTHTQTAFYLPKDANRLVHINNTTTTKEVLYIVYVYMYRCTVHVYIYPSDARNIEHTFLSRLSKGQCNRQTPISRVYVLIIVCISSSPTACSDSAEEVLCNRQPQEVFSLRRIRRRL